MRHEIIPAEIETPSGGSYNVYQFNEGELHEFKQDGHLCGHIYKPYDGAAILAPKEETSQPFSDRVAATRKLLELGLDPESDFFTGAARALGFKA